MVQVSRRDLELLAVGFGIADFLSEGRLTKPISKATKAALRKAAPAIARGIVRYGPTVAKTAVRVTPGPVAGAALGVAAIQNRERITDAAGNIYERVAPAAQEYGAGVIERALDPATYQMPEERNLFPFDVVPQGKRKKKKSKFNRAVSKGMSAVKMSKFYGKKGTINNAKRAFSAVTKVASKVNAGKKVSAKGVTGTIKRAIKGIL